jgi:hypothetical protein
VFSRDRQLEHHGLDRSTQRRQWLTAVHGSCDAGTLSSGPLPVLPEGPLREGLQEPERGWPLPRPTRGILAPKPWVGLNTAADPTTSAADWDRQVWRAAAAPKPGSAPAPTTAATHLGAYLSRRTQHTATYGDSAWRALAPMPSRGRRPSWGSTQPCTATTPSGPGATPACVPDADVQQQGGWLSEGDDAPYRRRNLAQSRRAQSALRLPGPGHALPTTMQVSLVSASSPLLDVTTLLRRAGPP